MEFEVTQNPENFAQLFNSYIIASTILSYYEIIIFTNIRIQRKQLL